MQGLCRTLILGLWWRREVNVRGSRASLLDRKLAASIGGVTVAADQGLEGLEGPKGALRGCRGIWGGFDQ